MVCVSVDYNHQPYRNSWTDRGAVWDMDSHGLQSHVKPGSPKSVAAVMQPFAVSTVAVCLHFTS